MKIVLLLCAAFVLRVATEPIKSKLGAQPNRTQEATPGPLTTQAAERKTKDQPLPVTEAGKRTLGDMRPNGEGCFPEWVRYGTRCFKLFTTPMTWINAEKECNAFIANLASIHNLGEHDFLYSLAKRTNEGRVWIGGSDAVKTSTWLWSDGSMFCGYTNWGSGEPNSSQERCMEMNSQGWNDQNCDDSRPFICGTRPDAPLQLP